MVLTVSAPGCWCWVGPGPLIAHSEGRSVSVGFQVTFCITRREVASSEIFTLSQGNENSKITKLEPVTSSKIFSYSVTLLYFQLLLMGLIIFLMFNKSCSKVIKQN